MRSALIFLALLVVACYSAVVDDFSVGNGEQTLSVDLPVTVGSGGSASYFSFYEDPTCSGLLDCHRVILLGISRGNAGSTFTASVRNSGANEFYVTAPSGSTSEFTLKYDGSNSQTLNRNGLSVDLSQAGGVQMTVDTSSSLPTTVTIYSSTQSCDAFTTIRSNGLVQLPFSSFSGNCPLSNVGAITLKFEPSAGSNFAVRQIETFVSDGRSPTPVLTTRSSSPSPSRSRASASASRSRQVAVTAGGDGSVTQRLPLNSNQGGTITVDSITATFPIGTFQDNTVVTGRLTPVSQAGLTSSEANKARAGDIISLTAASTSGNARSPRTYYEICFGLTGGAANTPANDLCMAYVNPDDAWQCDDNTVYADDNDNNGTKLCGTTARTGVFSLLPKASAVADNSDDDDVVINTLSRYVNVSPDNNDDSAASRLVALAVVVLAFFFVLV